MIRAERNGPLWFIPNNTCCFISLCVFVRVHLFVSLCIVVNCSDPGIPANSIRQSKIEHGNFTFGTVVFYDCNPGYYLFGSPVLTCQPTGQWDKPLPECIGKFYLLLSISLPLSHWSILFISFPLLKVHLQLQLPMDILNSS